jgi:hypothetical protein
LRPELQNRFQLKCEMEFGILRLDDGLPGFSGWERKLGLWTERVVVAIGPLVNVSNNTICKLPHLLTILYIHSIFS